MVRPSNALIRFDIPGRRLGGVRVNQPAAGKRSYRVLWTDDNGSQRERTKPSLVEAEALAESIAIALAGNQPGDHNDATLGDLLVYHLDGPGRSPKWTSEKSARWVAAVARRIFTEQDLTRDAHEYCSIEGRRLVQGILDRAARAGCKPGSSGYAKAGGLLKTLFDIGERDGMLTLPDGNPMQGMRYRLHHFSAAPSPELLTVNYIGPEQRPPTDRVHDFIDATRQMFGTREARYVEVLAFAGLRPGEANGLTRAQLRTDRPGLRIDQQLLELTPKEAAASGGETQQLRPPKWGQFRNAFYPQTLLDGLFELVDAQPIGPNGVLFPTRSGALRRQGNWRRGVFIPVATRVGWPTERVVMRGRVETHWVWPVYAFRHHYANYLLKDLGLPLVSVARFMGHRDARVTERMYLKTELDDLDTADRLFTSHQNGSSS